MSTTTFLITYLPIVLFGVALVVSIILGGLLAKLKQREKTLESALLEMTSRKEYAEEELADILEATTKYESSTAVTAGEDGNERLDTHEERLKIISHIRKDLCAPVNAIMGLTSIAKDHLDDTDRVEDCLEKVEISGNQFLSLMDEILDVNNLQSGRIHLSAKPGRLEDIVKASVASFKDVAEKKLLDISMELPNVELPTVLVDEGQVVRMLRSILSNAVNYTEENGRIKVSLSLLEDLRDSVFCAIQVEDTGVGISPEFLDKLFEPFAREEEGRDGIPRGAGLGLTSARYIARLMSGDLTAVSKKGEGSTFTITIRLAKVYDDQLILRKADAIPQVNRRVLLVEDDAIHDKIATEVLQEFGLTIDHAADGKQAIDMLMGAVPDTYVMVFMDIKMPVMDGYEATRRIRECEREDLKNIPIVALTGEVLAEYVQKALNAGMNAHVAKPIIPDHLKNVVKKFIA